jgi:hypothetical protein
MIDRLRARRLTFHLHQGAEGIAGIAGKQLGNAHHQALEISL